MKSLKMLSILLAFAIHLHFVPSSDSQTSPIAIHPERRQLLEDAFSWLTLRMDGKLLTADQSAPFLKALRKEYRRSHHLRVVTISFLYGVLPKLTLGQGATCESAYHVAYRDSYNDTMTWWLVKHATQELYAPKYGQVNPNQAHCDYRQGLLCHSTTKKCICPEGSKMGPIEENSPIQRCQVEEDQPCALADLAISTTNEKLTGKLHEMIFNLEKPLSCEWGTQCRHKGTRYTKCISSSKAPFDTTIPDLNYGEECVVDYIGEMGNCQVVSPYYNGATCFNFWGHLKNKTLPPGVNRRMGFCASDMAPYVTPGITYKHSQDPGTSYTDYFLPIFVNPRTVKMSSSDLLSYDKELHQITKVYRDNRIEEEDDKPCSVADTNKIKEIWNFYHGLEGNSPQGFVADVPTLNAKLAEYKNLLGNKNEPKICRIVYEIRTDHIGHRPPLICDGSGSSPDAAGNDGKCVQLQDKDEKERLFNFALRQRTMFWNTRYARAQYRNPESYFNSTILWNNPDKQCTQTQTEVRNGKGRLSKRGEVLEDGTCEDDRYSCFEDLSDKINIYVGTPSDCNFKPDYEPKYACFDVKSYQRNDLGQCENTIHRERTKVALETASKLGWGAACDYQMEQDIPQFLAQEPENTWISIKDRYNGYRMLFQLESLGICDPPKLLECSAENTCTCIARDPADGMYTSDYCLDDGRKPAPGGGKKPLEPPVPFGGSEMTLKRQPYSVLVISMTIVSIPSLYR